MTGLDTHSLHTASPTVRTSPAPRFQLAAVGWAGLAVFMAGLGQLYFSLRLPRLDGLIFYAIAAVAFWRFLRYAPRLPALPLAEQGTAPATKSVAAIICGALAVVLSALAVFSLRDP